MLAVVAPIGTPFIDPVPLPVITGLVIVGVVSTIPVEVHAEITPLATVPSAGAVIVGDVNVGVASVGLVANTKLPVPVSPVTAAAKFALVGVVKNVCGGRRCGCVVRTGQ